MKKVLAIAAFLLLPFLLQGGVVKGRVSSEGRPVAGVQVSDGRQIVLTDARGRYSMKTDKADSIVFITTPSGYIAEPIDPVRPGFWQLLTEKPCKTEVHDFNLVPQDQNGYSVIFITDCHLADDPSRNCLERFRKDVLPVVKREYEAAAAKGPVFTMNLGDFSHDRYWYDFDFNEADAERFLVSCGYPTPVYTVTGNHDNDGAVAGLGERTDFVSAWNYRHTWGPGCYSVNIGGDHWIFMDTVEYINDGDVDKRHKNINGKRNYRCRILDKDIEWLRKDLQYVRKDSRIFLCTHVPLFNDAFKSERLEDGQVAVLDDVFKDYPTVYVYSGHTHKHLNSSSGKYPRFKQFIFAATSGNMWNHPEGYQAIESDSSDQAINVMDCRESDPRPRFVHITGVGKMLRAYDINTVAEYYRTDPQCRIFHRLYPNRTWFADPEFENMVYVNYWGYAPGQKVEMFENGKPLKVSRKDYDEPLAAITYVTPGLNEGSTASKSNVKNRRTSHTFVATASTSDAPVVFRATDAEGNVVCEEEIIRPKVFNQYIH